MKNALLNDSYENPWIDLLPFMQMQIQGNSIPECQNNALQHVYRCSQPKTITRAAQRLTK